MKVTRRRLAQTLAVAAAGSTLPAQGPQPAPAQTASDPELDAARAQLRGAARAVASVVLPMSTEPATRFIPRT